MAYLGNSPGVASQRVESAFTATSAQTVFTPSSGYTLGYCDVYQNGVKLVNGDDYTAADGVSITLATGATTGDSVVIVASFPRGLSDGYLKAEADAKYVALTGDQTIAGVKTFSSSILHLQASSQPTIQFTDVGTGAGRISMTNAMIFGVDGSDGSTDRMFINSSGNVGIGWTPSAWGSAYRSLQIGSMALLADANGASDIYSNLYYTGAAFKFMANGYATGYSLAQGKHRWYATVNNTAGADATASAVTLNMTLDPVGNLALGAAAPVTGGGAAKWITLPGLGNNYSGGNVYTLDGVTKALHYFQSNYLVSYGIAGVGMKFTVNNNIDVTIDTSGNLVLPSGAGISFAATGNGSGSVSSEILSDYEEGTWTPVWNGGGTLTAVRCRYTKIGRMVTLHGTMDFGTNVNGGTLQISGLPYASSASVEATSSVMANFVDFPSGYTMLTMYWYGGANYIAGYWSGHNVVWSATTNAQVANASLIFTMTYEAA